jgi:hypothetical protein
LLASFSDIPPQARQQLVGSIWQATQFLIGSTTRRIPYELVHSLELAAEGWTAEKIIITTAIVQERQFYFKGVSAAFYELAKDYFNVEFEQLLAQIAFPEIYRHKPLYAVALFHELGHFLDVENRIVRTTFLLQPPLTHHVLPGFSSPLGLSDTAYTALQYRHRGEYFCDLFAACYAGEGYAEFLGEFAEGDDASPSHPATIDRVEVMRALLRGDRHVLVEMFNETLTFLGRSILQPRYVVPSVDEAFGNARPVPLKSDSERFGLMEAGWKFLGRAKTVPIWKDMPEEDLERKVNDLVEKSLRNHMITKKWAGSGT